jgi:hypothetical protein
MDAPKGEQISDQVLVYWLCTALPLSARIEPEDLCGFADNNRWYFWKGLAPSVDCRSMF